MVFEQTHAVMVVEQTHAGIVRNSACYLLCNELDPFGSGS